MRKIFFLGLLVTVCFGVEAQLGVRYDPTIQSTGNINYFKPQGNLFVGDCIPFFHDGKYYLYWLLDSAHHRALNGLGGHQWALSVSADLKTWKQYPVVLGIDEAWEKSICTGSVAYHAGKFYAFYATRLIDSAGKVNEQLSYAVSDDGIHFVKRKPNPFYTSAPGYSKRNFRDPKVIIDADGTFHLFVASDRTDAPTAEFNGGRRILAGWIPSRRDLQDNQGEVFGGNIVLRELSQEKDGTLNTFWPAEAAVSGGGPAPGGTGQPLNIVSDSLTHKQAADAYTISSTGGLGAFFCRDVSVDCRIDFEMSVKGAIDDFGCFLRSDERGQHAYVLRFSPQDREVTLAGSPIHAVEGLETKQMVQIVMKDDIIDVCIGGKRCIVNRLYAQKGSLLGFFARHGTVSFTNMKVSALN
jgi:hypothetical protein